MIDPITNTILRSLLDYKADVNKFWESKTVFHMALENGREDLVALLLDAKANVNLKTRTFVHGCECVSLWP
jgi:ankyrin repeat protein